MYVAGTVDSVLIREGSIIRDVLNGEALHPPFHTGTAIRILSGFWHSHWQANPGLIRIETRIADPGGKQDLDPG